MSADVVLGLDCGTSYIKLSTFDRDGIEVDRRREPSPFFNPAKTHDVAYAARLWRKVERVLGDAITRACAKAQFPHAAAILGISPVLTLFDPDDPDRALAMPYWHLPSVDGTANGLERTIRRITQLRVTGAELGLSSPVICDLIGYLNYRLTGQLAMNSVTAGELGFLNGSQLMEAVAHSNRRLSPISLLSPSETCGIAQIAPYGRPFATRICGGSPDSFGAALSSGATHAGSRMIYLGTFGSLLEIVADLLPLVSGPTFPCHPYRWRVSAPGFGRAVEGYARAYFPTGSLRKSLRQLDRTASRARPGAEGVFFHLPIWDDFGAEQGSFGFAGWHGQGPPPQPLGARAVLESLAYAIRARAADVIETSEEFGLAGGGSASKIWRQIVADALGLPIRTPRHAAGAFAAASIAGIALGWDLKATSAIASALVTVPDLLAYSYTHETARRAAAWYGGEKR